MNIIDLQENLKDLPDKRLMQEMQRPTGSMPQFLVLSELQRRKRMRDDFKRQEAADMPTVAEEMITGAGVPQEGIMAMAGAMAPKTNVAQDTGLAQAMPMQATRAPQMAADGGILNLFTGGRTREDLYRRVEPFPEDGTAAERRNWTLTYGMTHDADGMPKRMLPDVATTDVSPTTDYKSPFISDVSADIGDFVPSPITSEVDQLANQGKSPNLNNISRVGSLPFLPSGSLGIGADTDTEDLLETMLKANEGIARDELPESADSDLRFSRGTASTNALKDAVVGSGISSRSIDPSSVVGNLPFLPPPTGNEYSELPIRGADTDPAQQLAEFLASRRSDLPGVNLPGESYPYEIDPDAAEKQGQAILDSEAKRLAEKALQDQEGSFDQPNTDPKAELAEYLRKEREDYNKILAERGPEDTAGKDSLKRLLVRPPVAEFLSSFKSEPEEKIASKADEDRRDDPELAITKPTTIAEDAETSAEKALQDQEDSFTQPSTVTDGGADGAGFGSAESEMSRLLSDRRKRADQNKWLALAEAGFAMMGPAATFGEGIGKGGKAGLAALRESQKGMDAFESDMLKLQASMNIADARNQTTLDVANIRSNATLNAALARLKGSAKNAPVGLVTAAASQVDDARTALQFARTDPEKLLAKNALEKAQATYEEIFNRVASQFPATSGMPTTTLSGRTQVR